MLPTRQKEIFSNPGSNAFPFGQRDGEKLQKMVTLKFAGTNPRLFKGLTWNLVLPLGGKIPHGEDWSTPSNGNPNSGSTTRKAKENGSPYFLWTEKKGSESMCNIFPPFRTDLPPGLSGIGKISVIRKSPRNGRYLKRAPQAWILGAAYPTTARSGRNFAVGIIPGRPGNKGS